MDQFRQLGEVVGGLKALMVLKHDIAINQRQCCLLFDMFLLAFETISDEIRQNLRLDERNTKWKPLEYPMRELHRIFKEGENYIRFCLDVKDWWGKAISLHLNRDCVEFHIHNLLSCFPVVIEAIEAAAEFSVTELEDMQNRRAALTKKYEADWNNPKLFQWMCGKQYLVPREVCSRFDAAWNEDGWSLVETIREKKSSVTTTLAKYEQFLGDLLLNKLNGLKLSPQKLKLLPSSVLVGSNDYYVKRRLGLGEGHIKEIQWLGESFAMRTFFGEIIEPLSEEISLVLSLSHPNILQHLCGFYDEERKEGFLVMELMNKNLKTYIKENCGQRKRLPFSIPIAVDIMLQIARGLEYLHSRKVYHGELNPSNILLRARNSSTECHFHVKITGFGLISIKSYARSPNSSVDPVIWYAPEVLAEQEQPGKKSNAKYSEKADVYSFGMLCFELLTGKVPFEDSHLQGDKMVRNIRAGGRPLFSFPTPKYLANLTRKCWHHNSIHRPSFSSICRILRYIKKILIINPDHGQPESPPPLVDYCDLEAAYSKKFSGEGNLDLAPVSEIPFQLYAYRLVQKEKCFESSKVENWDLGNVEFPQRSASVYGEEHLAAMDDLFLVPSDRRSVCSEIIESKNVYAVYDQRTIISDIPHKIFLSDQRSIGSESPQRKCLLITSADQRPFFADTPERKISGVDQISCHSRTPERKAPATPRISQKKQISYNPENEKLSVSDQKTFDSETQDGKSTTGPDLSEQSIGRPDIPEIGLRSTAATHHVLLRKVSSKKIAHRRKLSEIPEKGVSASLSKPKSSSSGTSKKKTEPTKAASKSAHPKNSDKKISLNKKMKDVNTANSPGKYHSFKRLTVFS
ncbi:hypothetical protein ACH5RR_041693 [Cinchona calisaya]|uniref:Protein kinase domain-containing protein n=1 Tax=Cinchona calisaya TaxID=153742 RepID=A0ABD2XW23_9GENT